MTTRLRQAAPAAPAPPTGEWQYQSSPKIGWLFRQGHGHYTQFLNFRECYPTERGDEAVWIPLSYAQSGDRLSRWRFVPGGVRVRRNELWHAREGIARHGEWASLFFAGSQLSFRDLVRRYPSYFYTDLSPSLMRELAPWYDHMLRSSPPAQWLKNRLWRRLYADCRGVFTMSAWAARGIHRDYGVPVDRIHVALPGANLKRWPYVDRSHRPASQPVRILMVGGQFRLKGGLLLLEWAERTQLAGWDLDIVTWPGELPDWVRQYMGNPGPDDRAGGTLGPRLPRVRVHCGLKANSPELMALYDAADVFCLPTQADGSSIASLEAMASGLPVLVGAVGGIPELIRDGETGFLLRRSDPADLSRKLEAVIEDAALRHRVGVAARASCESYFNVERQLRDILSVIDAECGTTRPAAPAHRA